MQMTEYGRGGMATKTYLGGALPRPSSNTIVTCAARASTSMFSSPGPSISIPSSSVLLGSGPPELPMPTPCARFVRPPTAPNARRSQRIQAPHCTPQSTRPGAAHSLFLAEHESRHLVRLSASAKCQCAAIELVTIPCIFG
jgi:hypothetical protein